MIAQIVLQSLNPALYRDKEIASLCVLTLTPDPYGILAHDWLEYTIKPPRHVKAIFASKRRATA